MRSQLLALTALCSLILGCGTPPAAPPLPVDMTGPPAPGGTVVIGVLSDIQNWNPYLTETAHSEEILSLLYPNLAVEHADYWEHPPSFSPGLADRWELSEDGLSLTVHIDDRATWSDGVPVTSEDVLFSHRTQTSPEIGWADAYIKDYIESVEAVDAKTVRFRFTHVYPYQMMDVNDGLIIPAHAWADIPYSEWQDADWSELALSAGPFAYSSHTPMQELVLERNAAFWVPERPFLAKMVWRVVPNQGNLLIQLRSGVIDLMKGIPAREAHRVRDDPSLRLVSFPDRGYVQIIWNLRNPLFDDAVVRNAIGHAIDRQAIIDAVYGGFAKASVGPVLSGMWAFNRALAPTSYDVAAARRLLGEAGWRDSDGDGVLDRDGQVFVFELMTNSENQARQDICMLVAQNLQAVGIKAELRTVEWGTQLSQMHSGDFDAVVHRWLEPTQIDLEEVWHSAVPGAPTVNYGRYSNPEVDRLLALAGAAPEVAGQKPHLDRIQELIVADQPYTFLVESVRLDGLNARVKGADINAASPYFNISEWHVNTGAGTEEAHE